MDKALTVLGEYRFWHPHLGLCTSPHFVRWGEIYPIFGPRLNFFGAALTMNLIASPIPPDRRYRPVQEADFHAPVPTLSLAKTHAPIRKCAEPGADSAEHFRHLRVA